MRKFKRIVRWVVSLFFASSILAVIAYRFIPVYITPLMLIRCVENGNLTIHHHWIPLDEMSPHMPVAVMASEDARFLLHHGVDFNAIDKAAKHNIRGGRTHGASTISQQTAKNVFLWPGRSWIRKGFELYFTTLIEVFWGKHRHVMSKGNEWWESLKIGGGAAPIETSEGWLLFYHGVSGTCNGYVYSVGGAILDIDEPSRVKYRCETFLLTPEEWYEERGFVPNVCFPCATIHDSETGRIALYYGAADSYVGLAFTQLDLIIDYIKEHSVTNTTDTEIGIR